MKDLQDENNKVQQWRKQGGGEVQDSLYWMAYYIENIPVFMICDR